MKQRGLANVAALFTRLASAASECESMLKQWAEDLGDPVPPSARPDYPWENQFDIEQPDLRVSTSYQILAAAVAGEDSAFRFFSYMAANAADSDVMERAEMLAQSALKHAAMLRHERRRAYHDHRRGRGQVQLPEPGLIQNLNDLCYGASIIEEKAAALLDEVARESSEIGRLAAESRVLADIMAGECEAHEDVVVAFDIYRELQHKKELQASTALTPLEAAIDHAKQAFTFYDGVVRETGDETTMLKAQDLNHLALKSIQALSALFPLMRFRR